MLGSWQGVNGRKKVENPWFSCSPFVVGAEKCSQNNLLESAQLTSLSFFTGCCFSERHFKRYNCNVLLNITFSDECANIVLYSPTFYSAWSASLKYEVVFRGGTALLTLAIKSGVINWQQLWIRFAIQRPHTMFKALLAKTVRTITLLLKKLSVICHFISLFCLTWCTACCVEARVQLTVVVF